MHLSQLLVALLYLSPPAASDEACEIETHDTVQMMAVQSVSPAGKVHPFGDSRTVDQA